MTKNANIVPVAWIEDGWIYSSQAEQHARFWIDGANHIWGPDGAADLDTRHWIGNGWIWGPVGAPDTYTGFYIAAGWIYGPRFKLPFA